MRTRISLLLLALLASATHVGCSCSDTGLGGDASVDTITETGIDTSIDTDIDIGAEVSTTDPPFDPPIENLGDPGWRDSTEPWCVSGEMARNGWDIWSDHRGVFVILDLYDSGGGSGTRWAEHTIYFNGGTGWGPFLSGPSTDHETCVNALTGVPGGDLIGWDNLGAYCQLATFVDGVERSEGFSVLDVHVVNESLAYAIPRGDPRIVKYEDGAWGPLPGDPVPYDVHRIWANEEVIFAAGQSGVMLSNESGSWTVHDTRTMNDFAAVWGFSGTDIWASTHWPPRLLHYDGTSWEPIEWPDPSDPDDMCDTAEIQDFWGKDGVLFFHTGSAFVSWNGEAFSVLGHWPRHDEVSGTHHECEGGLWINAIWGNEVDEVFLAVVNSGVYDADCGEEFLLWWDGSEFHWF